MFNDNGVRTVGLLAGGVLAVLGIFFVMTSSPDPEDGKRAAEASGIADPTVIESGYINLRCGSGDNYFYRVRGKNVRGEMVTATVCCGLIKDCTVRY